MASRRTAPLNGHEVSREDVVDLANHITLPPNLPTSEEDQPAVIEQNMIHLAQAAITSMDATSSQAWSRVSDMLLKLNSIKKMREYDYSVLGRELSRMRRDDCLAFHLHAQNCGILILYKSADSVIFECFETSALSEEVMSTSGRLIMTFPGRAIACPVGKFFDEAFQTDLSASLCMLNRDFVDVKSSTDRTSPCPRFVIDYMMTMLSVIGTNYKSSTTQKHVRDEVVSRGNEMPWRRFPFWLFLRVSILRILSTTRNFGGAEEEYKRFMIHVTAELLHTATQISVAPDSLSIIHAKLARRVLKFEQGFGTALPLHILEISRKAEEEIRTPWIAFANTPDPTSKVPVDHLEDATCLVLRNSRKPLLKVLKPLPPLDAAPEFAPPPQSRISQDVTEMPSLTPTNKLKGDLSVVLAGVEKWVKVNLGPWTEQTLLSPDTQAFNKLANLIRDYWLLAESAYARNPLESSLALLTILELWVTLDKLCVEEIGLLKKYSPQIPLDLLEPPLLPKSEQMCRLDLVEKYIRSRTENSQQQGSGIFVTPTQECFSICYFNSSSQLQALCRKILRIDQEKRQEKVDEFGKLTLEYQALIAQASREYHIFFAGRDEQQIHSKSCKKCALEAEAQAMKIEIYEDALPRDEVQKKAAVFEIAIPKSFAAWRDSTWLIIHGAGRSAYKSALTKNISIGIWDYKPLQRFGKPVENHRVTLASSTKPFLDGQSRSVCFPVDFGRVCVLNSLQYDTWDRIGRCWPSHIAEPPSLKERCTLSLPSGPYFKLDWASKTSQHTTNEVMSNQYLCDKSLKIQEYIAFCNLRAGERLQSLNILRELGSNNLNQNDPAVTVLVQQAIWEAGSPSQDCFRNAHVEFREISFCTRLAAVLRHRLEAIQSNWQEQHSMATLIQITLRLLSLAPDLDTEGTTSMLLREARNTSMKWCRQLSEHLHQPSSDREAQKKAVELLLSAALRCFSTFDVDDRHQTRFLHTAEDLAIAAEAQTLVRENTPADIRKLSLFLQQSLLRHRKIVQNIKQRLRILARSFPTGLNQAIERLWNGAEMGPVWTRVSNQTPSWVRNRTLPRAAGTPQIVHYNLEGGDLLVGGKPKGKLPETYKTQPLFQRIFGPFDVLQVFASDMPGMEFLASQPFEGNMVHLGLDQGNVVIKIRTGNRVLQALPETTFEHDLPGHLVHDYMHWMDEATFDVEFRPLSRIWQSTEDCWKLTFSGANLLAATASLRRGSVRLLEPVSPPGKIITSILEGLDESCNCHITLDDAPGSDIQIHLPRYNLHFRVTNVGEISSLEYNAVVDSDQGLGTMVGLRSRLVLRDEALPGCPAERRVLIPCGIPKIENNGYHVNVTIGDEESPKRDFFVYRVDRHLQKLRGVPDLRSQLLKAYLHAVTAYVLPDPFTHVTGTEEAIETLGEASLYASTSLTEQEMQLLNAIATLTPQHTYSRQHRICSQKIFWDARLSPLVQHDDFYLAAQAIFLQHTEAQVLVVPASACKLSLRSGGDQFLASRARQRNASVTKSGLFVKLVTSDGDDKVCTARDLYGWVERAIHVHEIASLIRDWPATLPVTTDLVTVVKEWQEVYGYHGTFVTTSLQEVVDLKLSSHWGSLYDLCRSANRETGTYALMFTFCSIAFGVDKKQMSLLRTMLAFAFNDVFRTIDPPKVHNAYNLIHGTTISREVISSAIRIEVPRPKKARSNCLPTTKARYARIQHEYDTEIPRLLDLIWSRRSNQRIRLPRDEHFGYLADYTSTIIKECERVIAECQKNKLFIEHIQAVEAELKKITARSIQQQMPNAHLRIPHARHRVNLSLSMPQLLQDDTRANSVDTRSIPSSLFLEPTRTSAETSKLDELLSQFPALAESTHPEYIEALRASHLALTKHKIDMSSQIVPLAPGRIEKHHEKLAIHVQTLLDSVQQALSPITPAQKILLAADLWPRISRLRLLQSLSAKKVGSVSLKWKSNLLNLAGKIASLQRSERMLKCHKAGSLSALWAELKHEGRDGWSSEKYPSWLLLEIENNITIRPIQAEVAMEMIAPRSGQNSVLQLNMGEGKSSVILPMIVAALADGQRLVRVVALKPLLRQTELVLTERLGGLLGHRVSHIPFSRKTEIDESTIGCIQKVYERCKQDRGVMVTLPEEVLSMKLMTREKLTKKHELSSKILDLQRWLASNCRDVLDESDEILGIRSQLIYPMGTQQMLDGKNDRWLVPQAVLRRLMYHVEALSQHHHEDLEVDFNGKSFPIIKILEKKIFEQVVDLLVEDALEGRLAGIGFDFCTEETRQSIKAFIRDRSILPHIQEIIIRDCQDSTNWSVLLILRGLLAHGVLQFTVQQKRWLVEYGLDASRCLMAVPYRAKGVPSANSEFGHPDVGVLLTCLSYYYTGLRSDQIATCFKLLSKDSNAHDIYATWVSGCQALPADLTSLDGINLEHISICEKILFPALQYNLETIAFYLNQVVFPREGKEFAKRMSASGWDIPSTSNDPGFLTTGFSGTNDNRSLLPYSIKQCDLFKLQYTNASVLNLILQEENATYIHGVTDDGKRLDVPSLLTLLSRQTPSINVLIDVGAQVLEATNLELAQQWLALESNAKAVIFFDERDEATVLDRSGCITPMRISPFSSKLEGCLIYLDEVHTRGIDLAIPHGARAAVTLGPRLSKDRLMQACMRLRRLGDGHSLCFIAPPEVHHNIREIQADAQAEITSLAVLAWCIKQTCEALDNARPLRIVHGLEYLRQQGVLNEYIPSSSSSAKIAKQINRMKQFCLQIQENESQQLRQLYGAHEGRISAIRDLLNRESTDQLMQHLVEEFDIMERTAMENTNMDVEQEREIAHEIQTQRHIQRPSKVQPLVPTISSGLEAFVASGTYQDLMAMHQGKERGLKLFAYTSAKECAQDSKINPQVCSAFVTHDFIFSVALEPDALLDQYLRPVTWVLSSTVTKQILIISPHEANKLLPKIKISEKIRLHCFAARTTKGMAQSGQMNVYTVNAHVGDQHSFCHSVLELDLIAGSLYLQNGEHYERLCEFLGLISPKFRATASVVSKDGFISDEVRREIGWDKFTPFHQNPIPYFKQIFELRMQGQGFGHTHMGAILNGRVLTDSAFEEPDRMDTT
ncbi:hypothetical protein D6C98_00911 [Aureobasidium pullulans]|nr:hypothetical protein D6C98_00911 [Aureobasidium pullulans]THZ21257.1 hypothetical protein D6C89_06729 [Aureobasidium pullulans]